MQRAFGVCHRRQGAFDQVAAFASPVPLANVLLKSRLEGRLGEEFETTSGLRVGSRRYVERRTDPPDR